MWEPQVLQDQVSIGFIAVGGGPKEQFASISVGWMVSQFMISLLSFNK